MTSFGGNGKIPLKKNLDVMARHVGIRLKVVNDMADEIIESLSHAQEVFSNVVVSKSTTNEILKVFTLRREQFNY